MDTEGFEQLLSRLIGDEPRIAGLLASFGPRVSFGAGGEFQGEGHVAPLGIAVDRPMRAHVRMEVQGAPGSLHAIRLLLAPGTGAATANGRAGGAAWLPVLDVGPAEERRWIASRAFGVWSTAPAGMFGYQGRWQDAPGAGASDSLTRIVVRARHARGTVLWIGSRTRADTPGELHKHSLLMLGEADD